MTNVVQFCLQNGNWPVLLCNYICVTASCFLRFSPATCYWYLSISLPPALDLFPSWNSWSAFCNGRFERQGGSRTRISTWALTIAHLWTGNTFGRDTSASNFGFGSPWWSNGSIVCCLCGPWLCCPRNCDRKHRQQGNCVIQRSWSGAQRYRQSNRVYESCPWRRAGNP